MMQLSRPAISLAGRCCRKSPSIVRFVATRWQSTSPSIPSSQPFETRKWSTPLAKDLAEAITLTGPIPVASYMRQCLTSPDGGYYTTKSSQGGDQFGAKGDFVTSPEISQVFGELVGLWVVAEWMAQGKRGDGVHIIEVGPGRGTLMDDMLRTISNFKPLANAIVTIYMVEASKPLREAQHKLLCGDAALKEIDLGFQSQSKYSGAQRIVWCEDMKFVPKDTNSTPFIIAHEFFDALPIHIFHSVSPSPSSSQANTITTSTSQPPPPPTYTLPSSNKPKPNEWRELLVTPTSPTTITFTTSSPKENTHTPDFDLLLSKLPTPHSSYLPQTSSRYKSLLPHKDSIIEISPESLTTAADFAVRIGGSANSPKAKPSGAALILDYGPTSTIPTNSLRGMKAHKPVSPFSLPGLVDISADVDFTGLAEAAIHASPGVEVHGPVEQALFLTSMGIQQRAEALRKKAAGDREAADRIELGWKRLVDRGPTGMGRIYKAMAIVPHVPDGGKKDPRRPVGFGGDVVV
ncbi:DUF185-domain-containing protein [Tothia fuscella]|uniref:Protein arginine methyltransferase NDUFAF7 n=1 Tax=Tothia fuscella TaxID=1048955 RepID=A0A9P4TU55_9PEZI|nr:DUF185-domain-containing protein [Tothia fuscella]